MSRFTRRGAVSSSIAVTSVIAAVVVLTGCSGGAEEVSFKKDVFPILQQHCISCHKPGGKGYEENALSLETYENVMKGSKFGQVVVPGDRAGSRLNALVEGRAHSSMRMPHDSAPVPESKIKILAQWVQQGAKNN